MTTVCTVRASSSEAQEETSELKSIDDVLRAYEAGKLSLEEASRRVASIESGKQNWLKKLAEHLVA